MRADDVEILESMLNGDEVTIRISIMLECVDRNTYCPDEIRHLKLLGSPEGLGTQLLLGGVKLFADGALGSWGAALLKPYSDKNESSGSMLINETELEMVVKDVCVMCRYVYPRSRQMLIPTVVQRRITGECTCNRRQSKPGGSRCL